MGRPLQKGAKFRREYCICVEDPMFHIRKYYIRNGYKSLILKDFVSRFPDMNVSIYVLSGRVFSNIK